MTFPLGRSVGPKADRRSSGSARAEGALLLLTSSISLLVGCRPDPTGCGINDPCPPSTLEILPNASSDLEVGRTMQLDARVLDQAGRVATGVPVAWTSDRSEVASVDASGLVRGMSAGTSTIAARVESASRAPVRIPRMERSPATRSSGPRAAMKSDGHFRGSAS